MNQEILQYSVPLDKEELEQLNTKLKKGFVIVQTVFIPRSDYNRPYVQYIIERKIDNTQ